MNGRSFCLSPCSALQINLLRKISLRLSLISITRKCAGAPAKSHTAWFCSETNLPTSSRLLIICLLQAVSSSPYRALESTHNADTPLSSHHLLEAGVPSASARRWAFVLHSKAPLGGMWYERSTQVCFPGAHCPATASCLH